MSDKDFNDAQSTLLDFFRKMNTWEKDAFFLYKQENGGIDKNSEKTLSGLVNLYNEFLTKRDRKTGRIASLHASEYPEYDVDLEQVIGYEFGRGKIIINTEKTDANIKDYKTSYRYALVKEGDRYLIDKKEKFSSYNEKWVNVVF